jgi:sugar phosphate permease
LRPRSLATDSTTHQRPRVFYGWYIVAASFLANFAYTEQFSAAYGVFITHLAADMGWGRTALAGVKTMARLVEAVMAPLIGPRIDRYGARWFMVGGGVVMAASFFLAASLQELWQLYLYFGFIGAVGGVCLGGFVTTVTIANWFIVRRGRAVALATMGISVGTMVLPLLTSGMIDALGWRATWFVFGFGVMLLALPAGIVVRRRPEDLGMVPDGIAPDGERLATPDPEVERRREAARMADVVWTRYDVLRTNVFWILVFSWGLAQFAMASTTLHMVPFFADLGYPLIVGAAALSLRSAIGIPGNLVWGMLLEHVPVKLAASIGFLLTGSGLLFWMLPASGVTLICGIILFGLGASGGQVALEIIWPDFFGRVSLGTVRGVAYPVSTFFAATGPLALGLIFDLTGSYRAGFGVMVVGCLAAAALIQLAQRPRPPQPASPGIA